MCVCQQDTTAAQPNQLHLSSLSLIDTKDTVCVHIHAQRIYAPDQAAVISSERMVTLHHGPGISTQAQSKDTFVGANSWRKWHSSLCSVATFGHPGAQKFLFGNSAQVIDVGPL